MMWVEISLSCSNLLHAGNSCSFGLLYTDPGSGALAWQLLLSLLFGAMFYARSASRKVKAFIADRKQRQLVTPVRTPGLESASVLSPPALNKAEDF